MFSFARYDPNFEVKNEDESKQYERISIGAKDEETQKLILHRACKTMTHEIMHMFGVRHCIVHEWLMNGTNRMEEADLKPFLLCPVCLRKLHYAIGFDIKQRYSKLKKAIKTDFSDNNHFDKHLDALKRVLKICSSKI